MADLEIEMAEESYLVGNTSAGNHQLKMGLSILDGVLDFVPRVSFSKDVVALIRGKDLAGNELTATDKAIIAGTLLVPSAFSGVFKVMTKAVKHLRKPLGKGNRMAAKLMEYIKKSDEAFASSK